MFAFLPDPGCFAFVVCDGACCCLYLRCCPDCHQAYRRSIRSRSSSSKWSHAFQFAGYYAAKEKGFYREAGLDVLFQEMRPGDDPLKIVIEGKAQYGVGNSSLLLARQLGQPVVVLASIFQHSPVIIIARKTAVTQGVHDLVGMRMMFEPQSGELLAYLSQEGVPLTGSHISLTVSGRRI